jgi:hypothetical protein
VTQLAVHAGIATLIILFLLHSALALVLIPRFVDRSDLRSLHHDSLSAAKPHSSLEVAFENGHFRTSLELQHFHPLTPVGETVRRKKAADYLLGIVPFRKGSATSCHSSS